MAQTAILETPAPTVSIFADQPLTVANQALVIQELGLDKQPKLPTEEEKKMEAYAATLAAGMLSGDLQDPKVRSAITQKLDNMGNNVLREGRRLSQLLDAPMRRLAESGDEGGVVATKLIDLKMLVDDVDPRHFNFDPGFLGRTLSVLPFIGKPANRYFTKFQSVKGVILSVVKGIDAGIEEMRNDNETMRVDQGGWRESSLKLLGYIRLAEALDKAFEVEMKKHPVDSEEYKFIGEEVVFTNRQKIQTFQKSLADYQLGYTALEVIIRNNRELIRGSGGVVDSLQTTLSVAATVSMAVSKQKKLMGAIKSANLTADAMRNQAADLVKRQGVEIQKDASNMNGNIDELKKAFSTLSSAFDDISSFRMNALEPMKASIASMDQFHAENEKLIARIEKGNKISSDLEIQLPY